MMRLHLLVAFIGTLLFVPLLFAQEPFLKENDAQENEMETAFPVSTTHRPSLSNEYPLDVQGGTLFQVKFLHPILSIQGESYYDFRELNEIAQKDLPEKRIEGNIVEAEGNNLLTLKMVGYKIGDRTQLFVLDSFQNSFVLLLHVSKNGGYFYEIFPNKGLSKRMPSSVHEDLDFIEEKMGRGIRLMIEVLEWKVAKTDEYGKPFEAPSIAVPMELENLKPLVYENLLLHLHPKEAYRLGIDWWVLIGEVENRSHYERVLKDEELASKKDVAAVYLKPNRYISRYNQLQPITYLKFGEKAEAFLLFQLSALEVHSSKKPLGTVEVE